MYTGLMLDEVMYEALPWLLWALGFAIVYTIASAADDAKEEDKDA